MERIYGFTDEHRWLSNFWKLKGTVMSAEHLYQAAKTLDKDERAAILRAPTPGEAKRLGATVTLRPDWEEVRIETMEHVLRYKFDDPKLRAMLVDTGDAELIEANTWGDTYWGVDARTGAGHNMLGKLLMKLRDEYARQG